MDLDIEVVDTELSADPPQNLYELLLEVDKNKSHPKLNGNAANALIYTLRKYKYWPSLQVKKFFGNSNLVLLHNTYTRIGVEHFQNLYDECRSVVLNLNAPVGQNVIVTFSTQIPARISIGQYDTLKMPGDICVESYEGTVVHMYTYDGTWHIGTSTCPTINSSRYSHPTKTHGMMFDETIAKMCFLDVPTDKESSLAVRKNFTDSLDPEKAYAFILIHYENAHIMDYTPLYGPEYMKLIHITTRSRGTLQNDDLSSCPMNSLGVEYAKTFESPKIAIEYIRSMQNNSYGILVNSSEGKVYKVSSEKIIEAEEHNTGNSNVWQNMLAVYIQNKQHYKIVDYQQEYCPELVIPKNSRGQELAPTYLIHTAICTMRDNLMDAYIQSTTYNPKTKRFWINKDVDKEFPPPMRFHMAQLRDIQITTHTHTILSPKAVYDYICHHQTIKNLRLLIKFFATNWLVNNKMMNNPTRVAESFSILNKLLEN
jgi:hypothetical protein